MQTVSLKVPYMQLYSNKSEKIPSLNLISSFPLKSLCFSLGKHQNKLGHQTGSVEHLFKSRNKEINGEDKTVLTSKHKTFVLSKKVCHMKEAKQVDPKCVKTIYKRAVFHVGNLPRKNANSVQSKHK